MLVRNCVVKFERYIDGHIRAVAYRPRDTVPGGRRFRPVEGQHTRVVHDDGTASWVDVDTGEIMASSDLERGALRSRRAFMSRCLAHRWDWFGTLTLDSLKLPDGLGRRDPAVVSFVLEWFHRLRSDLPGLQYAIVPELHKDGAFHFHVLLSGLGSRSMVPARRGAAPVYVRGRRVYHFAPAAAALGFTNFSMVTSSIAAVRYMAKYMTKTMSGASVRGVGFRRWSVSRGVLPAPAVVVDVPAVLVDGWHPVNLSERGAAPTDGGGGSGSDDGLRSDIGVWVRYGLISDGWVGNILSYSHDGLPDPEDDRRFW